MRRGAAALVALAALAGGSGCTAVTYLAQATAGQLEMTLGAQPIREVVKDPGTPPRIRSLLWRVHGMRRFGERHGLVATGSYATYVDLGRPAAVWVVSASEPLRFEEKRWSFPIVGSVPYLGWFTPDAARELAAELRAEGWDVDVREADAYSTLGWFEDPVLSTMIPDGDEALGELANVILHESVHATVYVAGQSVFDESIANFIGDRLTERYLDDELGPAAPEKRAWLALQRDRDDRARAKSAAYRELERLYASARPPREKLAEKRRILAALERAVEAKRPINNATLAQFKTYNAGAGALEALLAACGGSFPRLLAALGRLGQADFAEPQQEDLAPVLLPHARAGCR